MGNADEYIELYRAANKPSLKMSNEMAIGVYMLSRAKWQEVSECLYACMCC